MNIKKILTTLTLSVATLQANAGDPYIYSMSPNEAQLNMSQVQRNFILQTPSKDGDTRVSLLVVDLGGSTDVSPKLGLYLTFWKDGEESNVASAFRLGATFSLVDFNVVGRNKIELKTKHLGGRGFYTHTWTVSYDDFLKHFEREAKTVEVPFQDEWVSGAILGEL